MHICFKGTPKKKKKKKKETKNTNEPAKLNGIVLSWSSGYQAELSGDDTSTPHHLTNTPTPLLQLNEEARKPEAGLGDVWA
jgi:hypothetical protein